MEITPLTESKIPLLVNLEFPLSDAVEQAKKIARLTESLQNKKLKAEQNLLVLQKDAVIGLVRWRINPLTDSLETLGSPLIVANSRNETAIRFITQALKNLAATQSKKLKLTLDERQIGSLPPNYAAEFQLHLTSQSQAYARNLAALETREINVETQAISQENGNIEVAAELLQKIQANSLDPTAQEDVDDPFEVLTERIENGRSLKERGGDSRDLLILYQQTPIGLLLARFTHPREQRGGLFLGIAPEFRWQKLGTEVHYLGLKTLRDMGVTQYIGETFVGNTAMQKIFLANQCNLIEHSNYWEFTRQQDL